MIESYEPQGTNYHYVRVTFAHADYFGHVVLSVGGNCKGASVLSSVLEFWENCEIDDVENLVQNDCKLSLYKGNYDEYWFRIALSKPDTGNVMYLYELDYQELSDMIIAVELIKVEPEEQSD